MCVLLSFQGPKENELNPSIITSTKGEPGTVNTCNKPVLDYEDMPANNDSQNQDKQQEEDLKLKDEEQSQIHPLYHSETDGLPRVIGTITFRPKPSQAHETQTEKQIPENTSEENQQEEDSKHKDEEQGQIHSLYHSETDATISFSPKPSQAQTEKPLPENSSDTNMENSDMCDGHDKGMADTSRKKPVTLSSEKVCESSPEKDSTDQEGSTEKAKCAQPGKSKNPSKKIVGTSEFQIEVECVEGDEKWSKRPYRIGNKSKECKSKQSESKSRKEGRPITAKNNAESSITPDGSSEEKQNFKEKVVVCGNVVEDGSNEEESEGKPDTSVSDLDSSETSTVETETEESDEDEDIDIESLDVEDVTPPQTENTTKEPEEANDNNEILNVFNKEQLQSLSDMIANLNKDSINLQTERHQETEAPTGILSQGSSNSNKRKIMSSPESNESDNEKNKEKR